MVFIKLCLYYLISHIIILMILTENTLSSPISGVIEGFYWDQQNAVKGRWGDYSFSQRDDLIATMGNFNLNTYIYDPHGDFIDTMKLWTDDEVRSWSASDQKAKVVGVNLIVGLRPGWIVTVNDTAGIILQRLNQLSAAGCTGYLLSWDDTPGAGTDPQMTLQRDLINSLLQMTSGPQLWGLVPAYYAGPYSPNEWENYLKILNGLPTYVPFLLCSRQGQNPSSFVPGDFPVLNNDRRMIFWDNWIAVDTNTRIPWTLPPNRDESIYTSSNYGYVLNLAFPPERVIHAVYAVSQNGTVTTTIKINAAGQWAEYLVNKGFLNSSQRDQAKTDLNQCIVNDSPDSLALLAQQYPYLGQAFSNQ